MSRLRAAPALTFDDVLLVPRHATVHPRAADGRSRFTRGIPLNVPLVSAAMDTVTEAEMAIAMARSGGIGVIHKNMTIDRQAAEVDRVKRSESGMILNPITLGPDRPLREAVQLMARFKISGVPMVDAQGRLVGIITNRDLQFERNLDRPLRDAMTKEHLITAPIGTTLDEAERILGTHRIEKLPVVDEQGVLRGLITVKDIFKRRQYPDANKDQHGRLRVAAAVGVSGDTRDRAAALLAAGCDVIVVDSAHGHSEGVLKQVARLREAFPDAQLIGGNVATKDGACALVERGVDAIKVGVGPGAMCTTRMMTGVGRPQFSAVLECAAEARRLGKHVWADGGVRHPRDVALALAAGASQVMIGSWFAGTCESPGDVYRDPQGQLYKESFGMASARAVSWASVSPSWRRSRCILHGEAKASASGRFDTAKMALRRRGFSWKIVVPPSLSVAVLMSSGSNLQP